MLAVMRSDDVEVNVPVTVTVHCPGSTEPTSMDEKLDRILDNQGLILAALSILGERMDDLETSVGNLETTSAAALADMASDVAVLLQELADANARAEAAAANDVAQEAELAALRDENAAALDRATAAAGRINAVTSALAAVDVDPDNPPVVETPPEG